MKFDLETVVNLYEGRLEQQNDLIRDLQELTKNQFATKNITDELMLQIGERDLLSSALKFLNQFRRKEMNDFIKEDLIKKGFING